MMPSSCMRALRSLDREQIRPSNLQGGAEWCRSLRMNRIVLGALLGIAFGVADVLITLFGGPKDRATSLSVLLPAFFS